MPATIALDPPSASKRARSFGILALAQLLLLPSLIHAAPITIPTSLLPGAQYRLAFVTKGTRDATSTNIADYDAFVTAEANTEAALSSISWQVIGSTAAVSARDHTGTAPADYPGVPIFLVNDVKLVDDYADLWDGTLDVALSVSQHGISINTSVFTGTLVNGNGYTLGLPPWHRIGEPQAAVGVSTGLGSSWVQGGVSGNAFQLRSFYAISERLVVPLPEPSPAAFFTVACVALMLVRRVRLP